MPKIPENFLGNNTLKLSHHRSLFVPTLLKLPTAEELVIMETYDYFTQVRDKTFSTGKLQHRVYPHIPHVHYVTLVPNTLQWSELVWDLKNSLTLPHPKREQMSFFPASLRSFLHNSALYICWRRTAGLGLTVTNKEQGKPLGGGKTNTGMPRCKYEQPGREPCPFLAMYKYLLIIQMPRYLGVWQIKFTGWADRPRLVYRRSPTGICNPSLAIFVIYKQQRIRRWAAIAPCRA